MLNNLAKTKIISSNKPSAFSTSLQKPPFSQEWGLQDPCPTFDHHTLAREGAHRLRDHCHPMQFECQKERQKMWWRPEVLDDRMAVTGSHGTSDRVTMFCSLEVFHRGKRSLIQPRSVPVLHVCCIAMPKVVSSWWKQDWLLIPSVLLLPNDHNKMLSVRFPSTGSDFTLPKITFN